ncbi:MAG TPA: DNA polymerase Y family protein [Ornithinimicrobium sp.]|nr:DNA polymerase Y family protein [Ornithinimicrobium sp.]
MTPRRTAALWVPDWPVLAAMATEGVPGDQPAAVHDGQRLSAVSPPARTQGVRRGMRRRQAQQVCPELLLLPADRGRDVKVFEPVAVAAEAVVAGVEVARPGLLLMPAGGAGRYHGSEERFVALLRERVAAVGYRAGVGIADGPGAAVLAARAGRVVPYGRSADFLAPLPAVDLVHVLADDGAGPALDRLLDLLGRLGVHRLGDLAGIPRAHVLARFGDLGVWAHRVASGEDDRPTAVRRPEPDVAVEQVLDPPVDRVETAAFAARRLAEGLHALLVAQGSGCGRLQICARTEDGRELVRTWRTDAALGGVSAGRMTDRVRWQLEGWLTGTARTPADDDALVPDPLVWLRLQAEEVVAAGAEQGRLWGGASGADLRAHRALHRVQGLLGPEAVLSPDLQGGRELHDQVHLVPWGDHVPPERPSAAPWPGRLPAPAPATVPDRPTAVVLLGGDGSPVGLTDRFELTDDPAALRRGGRGSQSVPQVTSQVAVWAGPWPVVQRWWAGGEARAYLQVGLADGRAHLLVGTVHGWTVAADYD